MTRGMPVKCLYCGSKEIHAEEQWSDDGLALSYYCDHCNRQFWSVWEGNPYPKFEYYEDDEGETFTNMKQYVEKEKKSISA